MENSRTALVPSLWKTSWAGAMAVTTADMVRNPTLSLVARCEIGTVGALGQPLAINDGDDASAVGDPSPALELPQRDRHARACGAEHDAEELVRKGDLMVVEAVVSEKQPAR